MASAVQDAHIVTRLAGAAAANDSSADVAVHMAPVAERAHTGAPVEVGRSSRSRSINISTAMYRNHIVQREIDDLDYLDKSQTA